MVNKGKFIVIEGIDGSGKTTLINELKTFFEGREISCWITKEPTESEFGSFVNNIVSYDTLVSGTLKLFLILADREQHISNQKDGLKGLILKKKLILCDRYYPSTYVYQFNDVNQKTLELVMDYFEKKLEFDAMIYLDVTEDIALQRINKRKKIVEVDETFSQLSENRNRYLELIKKWENKKNILTIDANNSKHEVFTQVKNFLLNFIME